MLGERRPQPHGTLRRQDELEPVFARVTGAANHDAVEMRRPERLQAGAAGMAAGQRLPYPLAPVRPLYRDDGKIAPRREDDGGSVLGAQALEPGEVLFRRGGIDHDAKEVLAKEIDDEIVDHTAVVAEQARIEGAPGVLQLVDVVRERVAQKIAHARAFEIEHLHVRHVEHAAIAPHGAMLLDLRAVGDRHVPGAEVDHFRARGAMRGIEVSGFEHVLSRANGTRKIYDLYATQSFANSG